MWDGSQSSNNQKPVCGKTILAQVRKPGLISSNKRRMREYGPVAWREDICEVPGETNNQNHRTMAGCWTKWIFNIQLLVTISFIIRQSHGSIILDKETSLEQNDAGEESFVVRLGVSRRHKRYALEGSRWRVNEITYKISKYSDKLPRETVDKIIKKAFSIWSEVTNLKFTKKKSGKVHIDIR